MPGSQEKCRTVFWMTSNGVELAGSRSRTCRPLTRCEASGIMMIMRTTLTISDDVMKLARQKAAADGRRLREVIDEALRIGLALGQPRGVPYEFRLKTVKGRALPGVDLTDRDKLFDLMDGR